MPATSIGPFAEWLTERCEFLRNLEAEAERVLYEDKDTDKYRALMCQKAMFLQALPEEAEKHASSLPESVADTTLRRLEHFAGNASQALHIGSVFYMYALLYPDNHKKGDPNDLELLAADMRALAGQ